MNILKGIVFTTLSSLVIALVFAFIFRLPIPMAGMIGPFGDLNSSPDFLEVLASVFFAWVFYGALGGFIIFLILGGTAGYLAGKKLDVGENKNLKILRYSFLAGLFPVLFISTLDIFIGKW